MTAVIPDKVPSELVAGDTWVFTRDYGDYPQPTWVATIYFEMPGTAFNAAASASGTANSFSVSAATTASKKAGRYKFWIRTTDGSTSKTVEEGWIDVKADPAATGTRDQRSWARRTLDAIEATLEGRATDGQLAMTINGRSISRIPLNDLRDWRAQLKQEVKTEEGDSTGSGRNIKVRFNRGIQ